MGTPRFDPTHSLEFNLDRGSVKLSGSLERVLLPADALAALVRGADAETRRDFARRLGTEAGRRVAERIDASASPEAVAEHLGGEIALMGFGSFGIERWGAPWSSRFKAHRCAVKATRSSPASSRV